VGYWQLALRERSGAPPPPRALVEASREPAWGEALASGRSLVRAPHSR
jgi:hypothetical protein